MTQRVGLLIAVVFITGGLAYGACAPFGGPGSDDAGCATTDKVAVAGENKVAGAVAGLVKAINKCHAKQADAAYKTSIGKPPKKPVNEEGCEDAAETVFLTKATAATPPACTLANLPGIASLARAVLDANNYMAYCDGCVDAACTACSGAAIDPSGDDAGCVASTKDIHKAENGIGGCVAALVKTWEKCHQTWLKNNANPKKAGATNDALEEQCEMGPIPGKPGKAAVEVFSACLTKKAALAAPCTAATMVPAILGLTAAQLDGANNLVYCESPSGAFVD